MKLKSVLATSALALVGTGMYTLPADAYLNGYQLDRRLEDSRITESSGLARSTYARGVLWTHGDSGDSARIFAVGRRGNTKAVVRLRGATNVDFEDISTGRGHSLWVGDIGDDKWDRPHVTVYKMREPERLRSRYVRTTAYRLAFPDGPRNAEALLVHPKTGRLYVVSKQEQNAGVYAAPTELSETRVNTMRRIADAPASVTAGTFSPDGQDVVMTDYDQVFVSDGFTGATTTSPSRRWPWVSPSSCPAAGTLSSSGPRGPRARSTSGRSPRRRPPSRRRPPRRRRPRPRPPRRPPRRRPPPTPTPTPPPARAHAHHGTRHRRLQRHPARTLTRPPSAEMGYVPDVTNTYYQYNSNLNMTYETARINRGTSPNISISTNGTQLIAGVAKGDPSAIAWLDGWIAKLAKLAAVNPKVPVYATLDQEMRVRTRMGKITGESADPQVYGKALDVFFKRANAAHANIETTYWFVGYDRTFEGAVGTSFTRKPDAILFDPYANGPSDTVTSITKADMTWIKSQPWYGGQTVGLAEFGMPVANGDAAMSNFYKNVPSQLQGMDIDWAVLFNRMKDNDHQITHRPDGKVFPQAVSSFKTSMGQSG